jgi:hypothetical protein
MTMFNLAPFLEPLFDIAFLPNGKRCRPGKPGRRSVEFLLGAKAERERQAGLVWQAAHPAKWARA